MSVKIYQVRVDTETSNRYDSLIALGREPKSYDTTLKAFSSKEKAEEYKDSLEKAYSLLYAASGGKLNHLVFKLIETEIE